ncbi:MAG TPA: hypothetical protein DEF51_38680 [Myxococcales bacterium]|nr:hypothetical protein [Myxococcales bacterium]
MVVHPGHEREEAVAGVAEAGLERLAHATHVEVAGGVAAPIDEHASLALAGLRAGERVVEMRERVRRLHRDVLPQLPLRAEQLLERRAGGRGRGGRGRRGHGSRRLRGERTPRHRPRGQEQREADAVRDAEAHPAILTPRRRARSPRA